MQQVWVIQDEEGHDLIKVVADTEMRGAAMETYGVWHSPDLLGSYSRLMTEVALWLETNTGS